MENLGHMVTLCLALGRTAKLTSNRKSHFLDEKRKSQETFSALPELALLETCVQARKPLKPGAGTDSLLCFQRRR